jgi:parvulin-like peptidyl-prolyl isomerase
MAKQESSPRAPTRRQIALSKKEREQLRLLYMALGFVGILIIIVLAFGLIQSYIIEPNSPVATVNGQEITTGQYQNRVLYERFVLDNQLQQLAQQFQSLPASQGEDDQFTQLIRNQLQQQANQLSQQRNSIDRQTLEVMIFDHLIETEAARRGITVSDGEVTEAINRFLAGREGGLTTQSAAETSTARAEASATAALWTPTPTFTPSPTLTATQTITQPTATPANTPTPAPTPTFTIISQDTLATQYTDWLNTLTQQADTDEAEYRSYIRAAILRDKLGDALGEEVPTIAEQAHARHILVETEEDANKVIERLEAGEDFAKLAEELSTDPGSAPNGGDLGFVPSGRFVASVDEAVFNLPIGEISQPIESEFGWHIIEVLEREERELSAIDYAQSQRLALSNWLSEAREAATVEDFWSPEKAPPDPLLNP